MRGRTWRASRTLPGEDNAFGFEGCICKGTVWKITCSEPAPELSSKDFLWIYLKGEFKLPTTAGTHLIRESPNSRSYSFELNLWQIKTESFEFSLTKVDNGLEVGVSPIERSLPEHFDVRLEESLWFTLAIPAKWSLLEEVKGDEHRFTIRSLRDGSIRPRLRAPLEPGHGEPAKHLGEMFTRYLEYVLPYSKSRYHPVSLVVYRSLRASALSLDSEALWIPVSIETIVRQCFQNLGHPEQSFIKGLDNAIKYIEKWTGEPALKQRIVKGISSWRGQNPREALKQLVKKGVITEQQYAAWNATRNRMAHGQEIDKPLEELPEFCNLTHMALLRLLFEVIGYSGPFSDRSTVGWPLVEYSVKGQGDEADSQRE